MKKHLTLAASLLLSMSIAHAQATVTKVSVLSNGKLLLNGQPTTLASIESAFEKTKRTKGAVWYYRENSQKEPPLQASQVIELVVKYRLPVSMSSKPDFTDYIDENGYSKPRKP